MGAQALQTLHPPGLGPTPWGHLRQQRGLVPPAVVESRASRGSVGAARLRFRPVTETLGVLGQADAVVSASSDERMILLYTGPLARDQVGPGFPTW